MTKDEQDAEKQRVATLSAFRKDQELCQWNRKIAKYEMLKGINTGELYTWTGRYKKLNRDYGLCLPAWYFCCWSFTGISLFGLVHWSGIDAMQWIEWVDAYTSAVVNVV
jgi:hypothetical protein